MDQLAEHLQDLVSDDFQLERLEGLLNKATREDDNKRLRDQIRIRKSEIIAIHYPKDFPHFMVLTKEEEEK